MTTASVRALATIEEKERGWPVAEQVHQRRAWSWRQVVGKRHRRKQWVAVVRTRLEARGEGSGRGRQGLRLWLCSRGEATRLGAGSKRRKGDGRDGRCGGREERNRGGQQRKRRPRERATMMYGCCGRKGGEEEQHGQGWPTAYIGEMGKTAARLAVGSGKASEFGEGCGRGER
ncbi:hypothetical protein B296_00031147 [Ensete ventricosum]|uniref:Uncharacterized protein n=1 Tax=Ensete ventricosum TaxID=4639 RepID=A0A426Y8H6_ENSVE|nr:hypothetical protein B296_00031147 [Ensete ventricosum]